MRALPLLALLLLAVPGRAEEEASPSAFRFQSDDGVRKTINLREVRRGVRGTDDPRDKIPAIREPKIARAVEVTWMADGDRVLGVVVGTEARAYPLNALEVHEMVNDVLGGVPIAPNY